MSTNRKMAKAKQLCKDMQLSPKRTKKVLQQVSKRKVKFLK